MNTSGNHVSEYLILLAGLSALFGLFVLFRGNHEILQVVSAAGAVFYVIWGLAHHALEGRLNKLIAIEYILIGSLVFLVLFTALSF